MLHSKIAYILLNTVIYDIVVILVWVLVVLFLSSGTSLGLYPSLFMVGNFVSTKPSVQLAVNNEEIQDVYIKAVVFWKSYLFLHGPLVDLVAKS